MSYCPKCGNQVEDGANFCTKCGARLVFEQEVVDHAPQTNNQPNNGEPNSGQPNNSQPNNNQNKSSTDVKRILRLVAFALMIVSTVVTAFFIIPLAWHLPMTLYYYDKAVKNNENVGVGFKVCTLIFVNLVSGILMLVDEDPQQN